MSNSKKPIDPSLLPATIDRLVSNDINESERTQLLNYLESNQQHWRDVGVAFLEAQAWEQSFATQSLDAIFNEAKLVTKTEPQIAGPKSDMDETKVRAVAERKLEGSKSHGKSLLKLAAILLFAFGLGSLTMHTVSNKYLTVALEDRSTTSVEHPDVEKQISPQESRWVWASVPWSDPQIPIAGVRLQIPVCISGENASKPILATASMPIRLSDYDKQIMSRKGLEVSTSQRFVNATLPDGRDIAIPIDRLVAKQIEPRVN
jgi:hypothetical protein